MKLSKKSLCWLNEKIIIVLLVNVFLFQLVWINTIPYNFAPDEFSHFDVIERFVKNGSYPVFGHDPEKGILKKEGQTTPSFSALQPLPYLLDSIFVFPFKTIIPSEEWFILSRLGSALAVVIFVFAVFLIVEKITNDKIVVLFSAASAGFVPAITFIGSYVNSDVWALALSSLALAFSVIIFFSKNPSRLMFLGSGISVGLATLTRYNFYPLLLIASLIIFSKTVATKKMKLELIVFSIAFFFSCSWWFIKNLKLYSNLLMIQPYFEVLKRVRPEEFKNLGFYNLMFKTEWPRITAKSFYAAFDWNYIFLPSTFYFVLALLLVIFSVILLVNLKKMKGGYFFLLLVFLVGIFLNIFTVVYQSAFFAYQPQGRYALGLYPLMIALFSLGISKLRSWKRVFLAVVFFFIFFSNVYSLLIIIIPRYWALNSPNLYRQAFFEIVFNKPFPFNLLGFSLICLLFVFTLFLFLLTLFMQFYKKKL